MDKNDQKALEDLEKKNNKLIQENENLKDKVGDLEGKLKNSDQQYKTLRWKFWIMFAIAVVCILYFITQWY